jgi:cytochrome c5
MKPILKWAGIVVASLAGLLVFAIAYVFIGSQRILDRSYPTRLSAVHSPVTAEAVARGAHLTVVSTCTDCHGKDLTGTRLPVPGSTFYAPNLTIITRGLSDEDIDLAIRQGLRSDGKSVLLMPSHGYASFTDDEVASIIAYLRSLSPQGTASPEPHLGLGVRIAFVTGIVRTEAAEFTATPPPVDLGERYENGRHLAQIVCGQCHGVNLSGEPKRPVRPSPDLLIVAGYDRGAFRTLMRTGTAPGGRQTVSMLRIAAGNLSNLSDDEIDAIYDYLIARWKVLTTKRNAPGDR